jgi:hypothetical protein
MLSREQLSTWKYSPKIQNLTPWLGCQELVQTCYQYGPRTIKVMVQAEQSQSSKTAMADSGGRD